MATHCFIPMLGKRLRATELDYCGAPAPGGTYIVTDGFVNISLSSEVEDGAEIIVKKANGQLCVNEKLSNSFKWFTAEIEFCGVNPSLLSIVSNATPYADYAGDVAGFTIREGEINKRFALELWAGLSGVACLPGQADEASGYFLLPFMAAGVLGDITIDGENAVTFSLTGAYTKGGNQWGTGPYLTMRQEDGTMAVLPAALDPYDHLLLVDTALAPPPSSCEPRIIGDAVEWQAAPGNVFPANAAITASDTANAAKLAGLGYIPNPRAPWEPTEKITIGTFEFKWTGTAWAPFS
ncbi:major tail protein [Microbacterium phage Rasputia]|nr:major tail protein [Microbacterium phage Rasputia]